MAFETDMPGKTSGFISRVRGATKSYLGSSIHKSGMGLLKEGFGVGKMGLFGKVFGIGWAGYEAITGYQEGGMWGAAKNVAAYGAEMYAFGAGLKMLGIGAGAMAPIALGVGAGAALGAGIFHKQLLRPLVREHMKKHARLEMARPVVDQFGTVATMRQRSLMAMQNSKINGRTAIGNEAALMYRSYFR